MVEITRIYIGGVLIEEPVTAFTDLIAGFTGIISFFLLARLSPRLPQNRWMSMYFIFLGIGLSCAGLIGHAFFYSFDNDWSWKTMGWSGSAIAIFCFERASILSLKKYLPRLAFLSLLAFNIVKLGYFFWGIQNPTSETFEFVKLNTGLGLGVIVLFSQFYLYLQDKIKGRLFVVGGILWGVLTALVYNYEISLHKWFNYHDISHLMSAVCIFIMYTGARKIIENEKEKVTSMVGASK